MKNLLETHPDTFFFELYSVHVADSCNNYGALQSRKWQKNFCEFFTIYAYNYSFDLADNWTTLHCKLWQYYKVSTLDYYCCIVVHFCCASLS